MLYFNYNGKTLEEHSIITGPDNRGLRYGDGLFETIKYKNGKLILIDEHFARLWKGMQLMQFDIPRLFTPDLVQQEILALLKKNNLETARVRVAAIRGDGGLYDLKNRFPNYIIQSWPLTGNRTLLNENGLQLCIYRDAKKSMDRFSNVKHNNYLPYFMGALFAKEQYCNDAVILNSLNQVCDTTIANIFLIKGQSISTPALEEGCVAGVMRKFIIQELMKAGYHINETVITEEVLLLSDEVFLTNSIYNMRWVGAIGGRKYSSLITRKIFELLQQTNNEVFC